MLQSLIEECIKYERIEVRYNNRRRKKTEKSNRKAPRVRAKNQNKKVRGAIPTTGKDGTNFRSRIEEFTYRKLLEAGIKDFKYEQERYNLLDAFEYPEDIYETYTRTIDGTKRIVFGKAKNDIRNMTYMPDFTCVNHKTKTGWIIETKGFSTDVFNLRYKLFKHYLVSNNYKVALYKPNTQGNVLLCIDMIKKKYYGES